MTKFYFVSTTICVMIYAYSNISIFTFHKIELAQVKHLLLILESLIDLYPCHVKKVFNVGFQTPWNSLSTSLDRFGWINVWYFHEKNSRPFP